MTVGRPPGVPWPRRRPPGDPFDGVRADGLGVFVPAIMGVGLLFSAVTLIRDWVRAAGGRTRRRRTEIEAASLVSGLVGEPDPAPDELGLLSRPLYAFAAVAQALAAAAVAAFAVAAFIDADGAFQHRGTPLALGLLAATLLALSACVAAVVSMRHPHPPSWAIAALRLVPLTAASHRVGRGPSWARSASFVGVAAAVGALSVAVAQAPAWIVELDQRVLDAVTGVGWLDPPSAVDPFGSTVISIGLVGLIGLSAFRCRVMALVYPAAFAFSWGGGEILRSAVDRQRPRQFGDFEAFPSGHMVQATWIAGLLPLALLVLFSDRRLARFSSMALWLGVALTGLHRIHTRDHWPLDIVGGVLFGGLVIVGTLWVLDHRIWHQHCGDCQWSGHPHPVPWSRGVFVLRPPTARALGIAGIALAVGAAVTLLVVGVIVGLPNDPEGAGLDRAIAVPMELGLAVMIGVAGLIALRWKGAAALLMAVAATGIGLFSSVQYRPQVAFVLTTLLLIPAVLTWFAWQPSETIGRIAALALLTITVLTTTAFGSREIYGNFFGPTHPESTTAALESDVAEWLWLGGVQPDRATIVAGGIDGDDPVELRLWNDAGIEHRLAASPDAFGVARFDVVGLEPSTSYHYRVDEAGGATADLAQGGFDSPASGPHDVVIVAGACARIGSNGAVFDTIRGEQPDLFLHLGDLHYANLTSMRPEHHVDALGAALRRPAQGALLRSVPTAYVWDDHDYGPNDSDASSPSRLAVSTAYRAAVPHHGVGADPGGHIGQAFSVGRVRIIVTDTRSQRTATTMLGQEQLEWFVDELVESAATHAVVVWANPTPWVGEAGPDSWAAFADERRAIADVIAAAEIDNLVMVSGDAHMVGIDDGTNSDYAADGGGGVPVLHAAALDRPGAIKGGPYSHGAFPGGGRYGRIEIGDDGGASVTVRLSGHTWDRRELVALELVFDASHLDPSS